MTKIVERAPISKNLDTDLENFYTMFDMGHIMHRVRMDKEQGVSGKRVLFALLSVVFMRISLSEAISKAQDTFGFGKDVVYRFLNNAKANWESMLFYVSMLVVQFMLSLTNGNRIKAFVIDDTCYYRDRSKKVEYLSRCYDHSKDQYYNGFNMLTVGWTDGVSFIPLLGKLLCASTKRNLLYEKGHHADWRTLATRRRDEATLGKPQIVLNALEKLNGYARIASHVLFDSWFSSTALVMSVRELGYEVVCRLKNTPKQTFLFKGEKKTLSQIYKLCKKRPGRSKYLLSVPVTLVHDDHENPIDAKCVYVRNRNRANDWIAILSTDSSLNEEEVIQLYGKRWAIETFFKTCKSYLRLTSDFLGRSYDGITAHSTIVMLRYIFLAVEQRRGEDQKTLGQLFMATSDELPDISFATALQYCIKELIAVVCEFIEIAEQLIDTLVCEFFNRIPLRYRQMLEYSGCET